MNTAVGYQALSSSETLGGNTAIGYQAAKNLTSFGSVAVGQSALTNTTTGRRNTAIGTAALLNNETGSESVSIGFYSSLNNISGGNNVSIGYWALASNESGSENVAVGLYAGRNATSVVRSVYLGNRINATEGGDNEIAIGYGTSPNGSNTVTLGNDSIVTTVLKGDVGVGISSPSAKLDVDGGVKIGNDTDTCDSGKVGTLRYRSDSNNFYVDMCMQDGASSYIWKTVDSNTW